jgi:hypothetical protein
MTRLDLFRMLFPAPDAPPHGYRRDEQGRLVLIGLSWQETREFERLDESLPFEGHHVWPTQGLPVLPEEARWFELWTKHRAAVDAIRSDGVPRPVELG